VAVPDLRHHLQEALGDAHVLERELPAGGMSRLFLATERSLQRQVLIKLLPPELASEVSAERFRRGIQVAAKLHHLHVVQVLHAGEAGDLLHYTTPLVEGETLRAKLAREGELPVAEAVRVVRTLPTRCAMHTSTACCTET
jgi:eukaryotic-like serine/threonine-protein kinase